MFLSFGYLKSQKAALRSSRGSWYHFCILKSLNIVTRIYYFVLIKCLSMPKINTQFLFDRKKRLYAYNGILTKLQWKLSFKRFRLIILKKNEIQFVITFLETWNWKFFWTFLYYLYLFIYIFFQSLYSDNEYITLCFKITLSTP